MELSLGNRVIWRSYEMNNPWGTRKEQTTIFGRHSLQKQKYLSAVWTHKTVNIASFVYRVLNTKAMNK